LPIESTRPLKSDCEVPLWVKRIQGVGAESAEVEELDEDEELDVVDVESV
jgi:hypothetical protein